MGRGLTLVLVAAALALLFIFIWNPGRRHVAEPPPAFTDLAQIPAQVLFPEQPPGVLLDTPSLLSVSVTAPYLFDGRAPTLASVFEAHDPGERHGAFHRLEPSAQADLLRFLEAL